MRTFVAALSVGAFALLALPAYAAGSHSGGHDDEMAIGKPGEAANVARTIEVVMSENDDGAMLFSPSAIQVKAGLHGRNTGAQRSDGEISGDGACGCERDPSSAG